jgi:hypothetical protein
MGDLIPLILSFTIRTALLLAILWIMIKLQKLDYAFLPLLGAAALACGFDLIPFVGHYLAVVALYLCIWKITRASLFPDAVFTVAISYALVFAVNMLWLTAMIGDLRPSAAADDQTKFQTASATINPATAVAPKPVTPAPATPAAPPSAAAPVPPANQPLATTAAVPATNSADALLKDVVVKGVTANGDKSLITIKTNNKVYTLSNDEQTAVQLASGPVHMRLLRLNGDWATVEVNGQAGYLHVKPPRS